MFFVIKEHLVWGTKDVNIGRNGLTNINFASISNKVKFIDIMKYFLTSLGQLAGTLDEVEAKKRVEKITLTFLNQHSHFSNTWNMLNSLQKRAFLDIIVGGKSVIPYKKNNCINSINLKPEENGIFFLMDVFLVH